MAFENEISVWEEQEQRIDQMEPSTFRIFHLNYTASVAFGNGGKGNKKGGFYLQGGKLARIAQMLMDGNSIRKISRDLKASRVTISRLYKLLLNMEDERFKGKTFLCKCGQPLNHQGWCQHRFDTYPGWQEYLKKFQ